MRRRANSWKPPASGDVTRRPARRSPPAAVSTGEDQPRRAALDGRDVDLAHVHHRREHALARSRIRSAMPSVSAHGVICQETPHLSLHQPHWLSCPPLPTMAFQ